MFRPSQRIRPPARRVAPAVQHAMTSAMQTQQQQPTYAAPSASSMPSNVRSRAPRAPAATASSGVRSRAPRAVSADAQISSANYSSSNFMRTRAPRSPPAPEAQTVRSRAPRGGSAPTIPAATTRAAPPAAADPRFALLTATAAAAAAANQRSVVAAPATPSTSTRTRATRGVEATSPTTAAPVAVEDPTQVCLPVFGEVVSDNLYVNGEHVAKGSVLALYTPRRTVNSQEVMRQYQIDSESGVLTFVDVPIAQGRHKFISNFTFVDPSKTEIVCEEEEEVEEEGQGEGDEEVFVEEGEGEADYMDGEEAEEDEEAYDN